MGRNAISNASAPAAGASGRQGCRYTWTQEEILREIGRLVGFGSPNRRSLARRMAGSAQCTRLVDPAVLARGPPATQPSSRVAFRLHFRRTRSVFHDGGAMSLATSLARLFRVGQANRPSWGSNPHSGSRAGSSGGQPARSGAAIHCGFRRYESATRMRKNTAASVENSQIVPATEGLFPMPPEASTQSSPSCDTRKLTPVPVNPITRTRRTWSTVSTRGGFETAWVTWTSISELIRVVALFRPLFAAQRSSARRSPCHDWERRDCSAGLDHPRAEPPAIDPPAV